LREVAEGAQPLLPIYDLVFCHWRVVETWTGHFVEEQRRNRIASEDGIYEARFLNIVPCFATLILLVPDKMPRNERLDELRYRELLLENVHGSVLSQDQNSTRGLR
jgi:hypothetical protein